jgi:hypothetical protein
MGETFQQVGVAVGVAGFGALFNHDVTASFASSAAGRQMGPAAHSFGRSVATAGVGAVKGHVPAALVRQVTAAARSAFVSGLTTVMVICAVVAVFGALVAFFAIRRADLHESAVAEAGQAEAPVSA